MILEEIAAHIVVAEVSQPKSQCTRVVINAGFGRFNVPASPLQVERLLL